MTLYKVHFTPLAEADMDVIIDYIATENPLRAISFIEELRASCHDILTRVPEAGRKFRGSRFFVFGNYIVVYDVDEAAQTVVIHMITHGARDWRTLFEGRMG